jgi:large subunit ribosomal protein L13
MKTFSPRPRDIERRWYVLDADGAVLGHVASQAAKLLRGKHKPIFAPHADTGDHVIVINARGLVLTGGKEEKKIYYRHSGYPGGLRAMNYARILAERPAFAVEKAIRGMLPKNRLGRQMFRKLAVYEGADHPHQAQKPVPLGLTEVPKWEGLPKPAPQPTPKPPAKAVPKPAAKPAAVAKKASTSKSPARARASGPTAKPGAGSSGGKAPARSASSGERRVQAKRSTTQAASAGPPKAAGSEPEKKKAGRSRRSKSAKES